MMMMRMRVMMRMMMKMRMGNIIWGLGIETNDEI
jgi:hypothetical protein